MSDGKPLMGAHNLVRLPLVCQLCKVLQWCEIRQYLVIAVVTSRLHSLRGFECYRLITAK
jgi:hypothetical protein